MSVNDYAFSPDFISLGAFADEEGELVTTLNALGHIGVYGTTRFGKTTFIHSLIATLIEHHPPSQTMISISDPKTVDYAVFDGAPQLFSRRATTAKETAQILKFAVDEMRCRQKLFAPFAAQVCNNLDRYEELSGERLPRLLIIIDELAMVVHNSDVLDYLEELAKLGLAFGIHLLLATQEVRVNRLPGRIKSQISSRFVTWMSDQVEYNVAKVPAKITGKIPREPGFFMSYTEFGWRLIRGHRFTDNELINARCASRANFSLDVPRAEDRLHPTGCEDAFFVARDPTRQKMIDSVSEPKLVPRAQNGTLDRNSTKISEIWDDLGYKAKREYFAAWASRQKSVTPFSVMQEFGVSDLTASRMIERLKED